MKGTIAKKTETLTKMPILGLNTILQIMLGLGLVFL